MSYRFDVHHHGNSDRLGLAAMLREYANDQWIADHYTNEQAAAAVLDRFSRLVQQEFEVTEPRCQRPVRDLTASDARQPIGAGISAD